MLHSNAPSSIHGSIRTAKGFTLTELLIVMLMVGILSAISAPTFMGMLNRNRVSNAAIRLKSALVEAQTNSTRRAKSCTVTIPSGNSVTLIEAIAGQCWRYGADTFTDVSLSIVDTANTPPTSLPITFDFKGRVTVASASAGGSDTRAIVISGQNTTYQRCIMVSYPLGIVSMGTYTNSTCMIDP